MKSKLAKARDNWLQSDKGKKCCAGQAHGQFLENRLRFAFIAGWTACEQSKKEPYDPHDVKFQGKDKR